MMQDIIAGLVLLIIVGAAAGYVYKAKKNGARCIGCSAAGCCSAKGKKSSDEGEIMLTPEIEAAFPYVCRIQVQGMTCQNCKKHVEKAFFAKGYLCKADFTTGSVEVKSRTPVTAEALAPIVADAGYTYVAPLT